MFSKSNSIGSSMVTILISGFSSLFNVEYSVVVLPLPVGPETRIIPSPPYSRLLNLDSVSSLRKIQSPSSIIYYMVEKELSLSPVLQEVVKQPRYIQR